jgi:DNA polymerase-3 subunit beta
MKLTVSQLSLQRGVQTVGKSLPSKPSLPILSCILVTARDQTITLSTTDLFLGVETTFPCQVSTPGSVAIPGKVFSEVVATLPPQDISLSLVDHTLTISAGKITTTLQCQATDEYPAFPSIQGSAHSLTADLLNNIMTQVSFAVSSDVSRPILTGVYIDPQETTRVVATDGFRLSVWEYQDQFLGVKSLLIPNRLLVEAQRLLQVEKTDKLDVIVSEDRTHMVVSSPATRISSRLLDGEYPPYQKILPSECTAEVWMDAAELLSHVKRALILARDSSSTIHFALDGENVTISAISPTAGSYTAELVGTPLIQAKEKVKISFNGRYLLDVLQLAGDRRVSLGVMTSITPARWRIEGEKDYTYVVMPFRVTESS